MTRDAMLSLEDAICEASIAADVTAIFIGQGLRFEESSVPRLTARDGELVYSAVNRLAALVEEAKRAFYQEQSVVSMMGINHVLDAG